MTTHNTTAKRLEVRQEGPAFVNQFWLTDPDNPVNPDKLPDEPAVATDFPVGECFTEAAAREIAHRYNVHTAMLDALRRLNDMTKKHPLVDTLSGRAIRRIAEDAIALATQEGE